MPKRRNMRLTDLPSDLMQYITNMFDYRRNARALAGTSRDLRLGIGQDGRERIRTAGLWQRLYRKMGAHHLRELRDGLDIIFYELQQACIQSDHNTDHASRWALNQVQTIERAILSNSDMLRAERQVFAWFVDNRPDNIYAACLDTFGMQDALSIDSTASLPSVNYQTRLRTGEPPDKVVNLMAENRQFLQRTRAFYLGFDRYFLTSSPPGAELLDAISSFQHNNENTAIQRTQWMGQRLLRSQSVQSTLYILLINRLMFIPIDL